MRVLSWRISSTSLLLESTVSIAKRALESRSRKAERNLHHHHRTDILLNRNHSTCHRCNRTAHQYCSWVWEKRREHRSNRKHPPIQETRFWKHIKSIAYSKTRIQSIKALGSFRERTAGFITANLPFSCFALRRMSTTQQAACTYNSDSNTYCVPLTNGVLTIEVWILLFFNA